MIFDMDKALLAQGYTVIAGVDEVGRGPLAGSVVAACVAVDGKHFLDKVNDSKKLSPKRREELYGQIMSSAVAVGIGEVTAREIDEMNIRRATLLAMKKAVENAGITPDLLLIDGVDTIDADMPQRTVVKGDATCYSIAAASIIAKVTRDRQMQALDEAYPQYGFLKHKGYGTAQHIAALREYGPCPAHRRSFIGNFVK